MWSIEIHFEDNQHMDRKIGKCDITYLNLLSLIESKGYCYRDSMYCLVEGVPGYELVDGMGKVLQMVKKCEHKQAMSLVVMQGQNKPSFSMLSAFAAAHSFALDDDDDEVMYLGSQEIIPVEYLFTQQSNNMKRGKEVIVEENMADSLSDLDVCSDDEFMFEAGDMVADDLDSQLREEKIELSQRLMEIKRRREHPDEHIEGDTDVEDLFFYSDNDGDSHFIQMVVPEVDPMDVPMQQLKKKKKVPVNKGPTEREHGKRPISQPACYVPSFDSGSDGDVKPEDYDGAEIGWVLPSGRKSRAKKLAPRVWYDEEREQPEDQLCYKMCFSDVCQFRRAIQQFHIAQLRNFVYHRNGLNAIIAQCAERKTQGCFFHMNGSTIGKRKPFALGSWI